MYSRTLSAKTGATSKRHKKSKEKVFVDTSFRAMADGRESLCETTRENEQNNRIPGKNMTASLTKYSKKFKAVS